MDGLIELTKEFIRGGLDRAGEIYPAGPTLGPTWYWKWKRVGDSDFEAFQPDYWIDGLDLGHSGQLTDLPSATELLTEIEEEDSTAGQFGKLVGILGMTSTILEANSSLAALISRSVRATRSFDFDEEIATDLATEFISSLASPEISVRIIVPLVGLTTSTSVSLDGGDVVLRQMEDREIGSLLSAGVQPLGRIPSLSPASRSVPSDRQHCVALSATYPKHIGDWDAPEPDPHAERVRHVAELVLTASRLGWECGLGMGPVVSLSGGTNSETFSRLQWSPREADPVGLTLNLDDKLDRFLELYGMVTEPSVQPRLGIPLRRFRQSCLRATPEDRLIDLFISGEGLFFEGAETELGFKLAVRAAMGPFPDEVSRSNAFRFMKDAYSVRSRIVHGARPIKAKKKYWPRRLDGTKTNQLSDLTQDLEDTIRIALTDAVETLARGASLDYDGRLTELLDTHEAGNF